MRWRFKRRDFIVNICNTVRYTYCRLHTVALDSVGAVWPEYYMYSDLSVAPTTADHRLPLRAPVPVRAWLRQITGTEKASDRWLLRWADRAGAFRYAAWQTHFWRQLYGETLTERLYTDCMDQLAQPHARRLTRIQGAIE